MPGARQDQDLFDTPAAKALRALLPPLRFGTKDGFAAADRLHGFGARLRAAVEEARGAGAPDTAALEALAREAGGFDASSGAERRAALVRVVTALGGLVPLPEELADVARRGRIREPDSTPAPTPVRPERRPPEAAEVEGRSATPSAPSTVIAARTPAAMPVPAANTAPAPVAEEPKTPAERARRRALLATRLADLPRVHPAPRALLEERGYETVEQALSFWPKAYQDRSRARTIAELRPGEEGMAVAAVRHVRQARMRTGKPILRVGVADATGALDLVFFNPPPWRLKHFAVGDTYVVSGKVSEALGGRRQMNQPEVEKLAQGDSASFGRIVPFYAGPADHQHPALRKLVKRLCDELAGQAVDDLPRAVRERRGLLGVAAALREAHFPPEGTDPALAAERATPAFRRLVFEELFFLQLAMARRRQGVRAEAGIAFQADAAAVDDAAKLLPFALTASQRKVLAEIAHDMARPEPMNRLLQGDVGSGKTAVAFVAMLLAVRSGWQAALLAPTQILAEQHARNLRRWLEGSGVEVSLVAAKARGREQKESREALASGRARIAVGTHALLEESVGLEKLGLVVVDEQHRFGVLQRAALIAKGRRPDVLVMTATPIPRTLALAFYGDLDQSKITELPPGRTPVETKVFGDSQRRKAYDVVRRELDAGHQAYVVYPLVAESEKSDLADATSGAEALARTFAPHAVGLLHGQMKADEKDAVMARFRAGELQVLVATTVIEVGVDVPNASVMVVEHAERFGLSQLHQLRGRVGRGAAKSFCLLVAHFARAGDEARERLQTMTRTQDGFEIARADLKLRGPGELVGTKQSGQRIFEIADLYRDEAILEEAREEAFRLVEEDPGLARPEHAATAEAVAQRWAGRLSLAQIG